MAERGRTQWLKLLQGLLPAALSGELLIDEERGTPREEGIYPRTQSPEVAEGAFGPGSAFSAGPGLRSLGCGESSGLDECQ